MSLTSISKSEILIAEDYCEVHKEESLDLYCTQHDKVYCRKCTHSNHQTCKDVLSLEVASKDIKTSSLLGDTLRDWQNIGSTLESLRKARDENINELDSVEKNILAEISKWKNQLITKTTASEKKLKINLSNAKEKTLDLLRKENSEISELYDIVQERKQNIEDLKEQGSNNQLYLTLREQGKGLQYVFKKAQNMTLSYKKADLKFKSKGNIKNIGSIEEVSEACAIQNSLVKPKQA
ncbi:Hypothetical predicted protein [Mytilus galloprovincialis]|uniref:B box-type domain-containing protein n=1 Tax=Mytilus galloprovincialis TaxID=29158 RepID=A0A8B6EFS9_MYTGA|nr:Hypothetical predicted protein [Mytilus galloprovincialis]